MLKMLFWGTVRFIVSLLVALFFMALLGTLVRGPIDSALVNLLGVEYGLDPAKWDFISLIVALIVALIFVLRRR